MKSNCYDNRELSWLKFNQRVLEEAKDETNPLCERLSFLSIFQSNLDEFFMVRCGSLYDQMCEDPHFRENKTNMTCKEQLTAIYARVRELLRDKDDAYADLRAELSMQGVDIVDFHTITTEEAAWLEAYFKAELEPLLSPQIIGKKQPFPFLQNKNIYAVVVLEKKGTEKLGIVPCSSGVFPKIVSLPTGKNRFILAEELILHFAPEIFSRHTIKSKSLIRIIRNADIEPDERMEEECDYREAMEQLIRERKKLCPIKLEFSRLMDTAVIHSLCGYLNLTEEQVFYSEAPLNLSVLSVVRDMLRHNKCLFYQRRVPQKPAWRDLSKRMIEQVEEKDRFLAFPYESIRPFLTLLNEAGRDPQVVSIKMTLYRVASNSKIVEALIEAAENGKDVVVLVELRARFDEENNIEWSRRLEDAGCRIIYGLDNLKVHSKLCLITKKVGTEISYITQVGTGNYNEKTSAIYTDYSLMTANHDIGLEANRVFHAGTDRGTHGASAGCAKVPAEQAGGHDRRTDRPGKGRRTRLYRHQNQLAHRQVSDRKADRGIQSRRKDRNDRPWHQLPGCRRSGADGEYLYPQHCGTFSGAYTHLHLRCARQLQGIHCLCGLDDPKHQTACGSRCAHL